MTDAHLRFAPEILQRLGEELIPHPDLGIIELVRNAYDADATTCTVSLRHVHEAGGEAVVTDDGDGMTVEQIRSGWLLLGKSSKASSKFSRTQRRRVGEKGLGRLGALRLGTEVHLFTHPRAENGHPHDRVDLSIDWTAFEGVEAVEDVALRIGQSAPTQESPGTTVQLLNIRQRFLAHDVRRLARALVLLTGPFPGRNTFSATLDAPEFRELEELVRDSYFNEYEYRIDASVDSEGRAQATLKNWRGDVIGTADHDRLRGGPRGRGARDRYECPPGFFELYHFNLSKENFDVRGSTEAVRAVQDWLKVVGGVHLFQRDLRVHPYGDPGHDWLDMNLRRARSPELRPSTNNSVGRIVVDDENDLLVQKTDRTGFLENEAFSELKEFGQDVLEWAAGDREDYRNRTREKDRDRTREQVSKATKQVEKSIKELPDEVRPQVEQALGRYQEAVGRQLKSVEDDLLLYRTLSTVGTTMAVFAHETLRPLAGIESIANSLEFRIRADLPTEYETRYSGQVGRVRRFASSMRTFAEIPLRMLTRKKRRRSIFDLNSVVADVLDLFTPYVEDGGVEIRQQLSDVPATVHGPLASAEAILANMLANSVYFIEAAQLTRGKQILVRTSVHQRVVVLTVADSGPGISGLSPSDVWLPGKTTREEGTGLGLTIVRDAVRDMGGSVRCTTSGELGGAEFNVELPLAKSENQQQTLFEEAG